MIKITTDHGDVIEADSLSDAFIAAYNVSGASEIRIKLSTFWSITIINGTALVRIASSTMSQDLINRMNQLAEQHGLPVITLDPEVHHPCAECLKTMADREGRRIVRNSKVVMLCAKCAQRYPERR